MKTVYLVTTNPTKILVANNAIKSDQLKIEQLKVDTPEIQSMDVKEIAEFSARWAADKFNKSVIKMDTSFWIEALKGFPGPFAAYADKALGPEGILKLMAGQKNRKAKFIMAVAYCEPGKEPIVETSILNGTISEKLDGSHGWFTDRFFIAEGFDRTMGCYDDDIRKNIWPNDCWERIGRRILNEF
jgi:XTP/dITP diphosphohydrolase